MRKPMLSAATLLFLATCSSQGKVTPLLTGAPAPLPAAAVWALSVQGCPEPKQCDDLRTALVGHLVGAGLASSIVPAGQPAELTLDVQVTRVRTVSSVERIIAGSFAGRNVVVATQNLRDRAGTVLRSFEAEGESAAHPISGETTLLDADREFAAQTVTALR